MNYFSYFALIFDHRQPSKAVYPLDFLLLILFSALFVRCQEFDELEGYALRYEEDLRHIYTQMDGDATKLERIPSQDTLNRILQIIDPKESHESHIA